MGDSFYLDSQLPFSMSRIQEYKSTPSKLTAAMGEEARIFFWKLKQKP